jgi:carbonic anhydrase/acetyltransferase-like protein (isoleucine patch superfamily)
MKKEIKNSELIIFGINNMAIEIKEVASVYYSKNFSNIRMVYFNDSFIKDNNLEDKINRNDYIIYFIIGFGGSNRKECFETVKKYSNFIPFSIVHPSAVILRTATIGRGCFVQPNTTISSNVIIGDHCIINYNVSIGHDSIISDNVLVQPGARISGNCIVGAGTLIGSNSFVYQNVKVGKGCLVDALTYIHEDLQDNMIVSSRYDKSISRGVLDKNKIVMWK